MDEAIKIADQIILMKDGQVVQKGTPQEILSNPANDFVREFIGEERLGNFLPSISDFMKEDYPSISMNESVDEAIEMMANNEMVEIPVVDEKGIYKGIISLYQAIKTKKEKVSSILDDSIKALHPNNDVNSLMQEFNKRELSFYPIQSDNGRLKGVVERYQLFQSLQQFYQNKCGGQTWK